ncbi:MAG: hypothetical protein VW438_05290, partial [Euryarchaeota archaeon]
MVGPTQVVIGVGEITGVPLEVIPSSDWGGDTRTIRILAQDEAGNQREISLDTQYEDHSWASSPVIVSMQGDSALLSIHGTSPDSSVVDDFQSTLQWDLQGGWVWQANTASSGTQVTVNSNTVLPYTAYIIEPSLRYATCSITGTADAVRAECTVANGTEAFSYTVILIDDQGKMLDDRGIVIASDETDFEIRRNDWNVGLVGLELEGQGDTQKIKVLTKREYHHLLTDADCSILVQAGSHTATHEIDFSGTYPPEPKLNRPSLVDAPDGTEMVVTVQCKFPWDIDSDSTDNEAKLILTGGAVSNDSGFEWLTAISSATLVISLALTVTWIIYNQRERKKLLDMTESILNK